MEFSYLGFAGDGLSWFLRVGAGFVLCLAMVRLLKRPHYRFLTWLWFLVLSSLYWGALVINRIFGIAPKSGPAHLPHSPIHFAYASHIAVPLSWAAAFQRGVSPLVGGYLGIVLLLLGAKTWKHWKLNRLVKRGRPACAELENLLGSLCHEVGIRNCRALVLPGISSPATAYWRSPRILLPEVCERTESHPEVLTTLYHEITHIRRRDYLWSNVSDVLCALLFFHPAVWQARKSMRRERELACDEAVVTAQPDHRADYATTLARFVRFRMLQRQASFGVDLAAGHSFLGTRIRFILADPVRTPRWRSASSWAGVLAFVAVFGGICPSLSLIFDIAQLHAADAQPPSATQAPRTATFAKHKSAHTLHSVAATSESGTAAVVYPDTLTTLRVHPKVADDSSFAFESSANSSSGTYEVERQALHDSSGYPGYSRPTLASVVLGTAGGIGASRSEHTPAAPSPAPVPAPPARHGHTGPTR
ncbi:MAG TPA: M56 family metallopeptidase [Candidatus Limnocylindrales bacterium]|nr:M56 family metallopeptidase [Candidatus Limnocylindrales bacterium]